MRKFTLKLIKTFLLIYLVLLGMQLVLDFYLSKENSCNNNTWSKIFEGKLDTDIAIIGTSRAESHYDTEIISKITGLKTYNLGISATPYTIFKIRWKSYINRNAKPKILIIDLDAISLNDSKQINDKFQYLPFFKTEEYQSLAKEKDDDFYYEKYIPLYKYRGYEMKVYKQIKSLTNPSLCSSSVNGYVEHDIEWIEKDYRNFKNKIQDDKKIKKYNFKIYSQGLTELKEIIKDCKQNNIKVYFIWSPSYYEFQSYQISHKNYIDSILQNISKENHIKYINFSSDSINFDRKYFYNSSHMNKRGAKIFSEKIGRFINEN